MSVKGYLIYGMFQLVVVQVEKAGGKGPRRRDGERHQDRGNVEKSNKKSTKVCLEQFQSPSQKTMANNGHALMRLYIATENSFPPSIQKLDVCFDRLAEVVKGQPSLDKELEELKAQPDILNQILEYVSMLFTLQALTTEISEAHSDRCGMQSPSYVARLSTKPVLFFPLPIIYRVLTRLMR